MSKISPNIRAIIRQLLNTQENLTPEEYKQEEEFNQVTRYIKSKGGGRN